MAKQGQNMRNGLLLMRMISMDKTSLCTKVLIAGILWTHMKTDLHWGCPVWPTGLFQIYKMHCSINYISLIKEEGISQYSVKKATTIIKISFADFAFFYDVSRKRGFLLKFFFQNHLRDSDAPVPVKIKSTRQHWKSQLSNKNKELSMYKDTCKYEPYVVSAGHPKINQASWFLL